MSLVEIEFKGRRKGIFSHVGDFPLKRYDPVIVRADRGEDIGTVSIIGDEWQQKLLQMLEIDRNGHSNGHGNGRNGKEDNSPAENGGKEDNTASQENGGEDQKTADAVDEKPEEVVIPEDLEVPEVLRAASEEELEKEQENRREEHEARQHFAQEISELNLEMNLVDVEYQLDRKKLTFYFTADGRVDFRELVKRLAQHFRTRIDLRQIGARDEAKRLGGIGICGRELCCATWIREFKPVTTSMLKEQGLLLNPQKNTGLCGKLRCCLRYEVDQYREVNRLFPKEGMKVKGPRGAGVVEKISMCHSSMGIKWEDGQRIGYSFDQVRNITDWDHEKRDQIEVIKFHEDPSIIKQEKEEREGRLLTSFEYEKVLEKSDEKKSRHKPRRRGGRRRGGEKGERTDGETRNAQPQNQQAEKTQQGQPASQGGESGREGDKRSRKSKRGRRGGRGRRRGEKQSSEASGKNQPQQRQEKPDNRDRKDRKSRRGGGKPDRNKEASGGQKKSGQTNQGGKGKPKGKPIHSRGRNRKR